MTGIRQGLRTADLFVLSIASLFVELLLIRWIGTEVRIFAYLQSTILVVCFLGLGMGCWTCRQEVRLRDILLPLLFLVGLMVPISLLSLGNQLSLMLNACGDVLMFTSTVTESPAQTALYTALGLCFTFVILILVWDLFLPLGRLLGRMLSDHPRTIRAYSVNVAGSLIGVWLFVLLSALHTPPVVWALAAAVLLIAVGYSLGKPRKLDFAMAAALIPLAALAGHERNAIEVHWSPYQKLALSQIPADRNTIEVYKISVNNSGGYQAMIDFRPEAIAAHPERYPLETRGVSQYDLPAVLHPHPKKMLILGAGSGNGTAAALRNGVTDVTSVDIDPVILDFGKRFHPEQPYSSPHVHVVCDDARSFLANATEKYDVIAYEFLDSQTTTSMTNTRLDHYVYTRESFQRAKELLAPGGMIVVRFGYERPFIADRMHSVLRDVFGESPFTFWVKTPVEGLEGLIMVAGDTTAARAQAAAKPNLASQIETWNRSPIEFPGTTPIATDDWPYLYLESRHIPLLYYLLGFILLLLFVRTARKLPKGTLPRPKGRAPWHFFFLGAAFMLLETQNVSKAAVALGSTWWVNAVIISAVLILILLANWIAATMPRLPLGLIYVLLCGSCLALYFVDISQFSGLPFVTRAAIVGGVTCLPMVFSGIVFIRSFAASENKDTALGFNLVGALVGGLLQSVTFLTGIQALLLFVGVLYVGAFLTRPKAINAADPGSTSSKSSARELQPI